MKDLKLLMTEHVLDSDVTYMTSFLMLQALVAC